VYSGKYDVCDVNLSVYPHRASLKNMPGHGGKAFQACPVWIYTKSNITSKMFHCWPIQLAPGQSTKWKWRFVDRQVILAVLTIRQTEKLNFDTNYTTKTFNKINFGTSRFIGACALHPFYYWPVNNRFIVERLHPPPPTPKYAVNMTFCGTARDTVLTNRQTEKLNFDTNLYNNILHWS
jgi:hypothetical protein